MADIYSDIPELSAEQANILRRQKIAQAIQSQAMQGIPTQPQMGRYAVPTNPLLALGKMGEMYLGGKAADNADAKQAELTQKAAVMQTAERQKIVDALTPKPEQRFTPDMMPGEADPFGKLIESSAKNQTPQDQLASLIQAGGDARFPANQKWSDTQEKYLQSQIAAKQKATEMQAAKESADKTAQDKLAETIRANQANEDLKRLMIDSKNSPANEKALEKQKQKEDARTGFAGSLDSLEANYKKLDELGGIVNNKKSGLSNIGSRIASSSLGQLTGGAFGTDEQSLRNEIKGTIPLLVLDIKNLTGASAQQMNSNVELQNFMRAASDPNSDIKSNLKLLHNLRSKYLGDNASGATGSFSADDAALLDKYK